MLRAGYALYRSLVMICCWQPLSTQRHEASHAHEQKTHGYATYTVFIRIVTVATINFSLAWVRLLIEGSSYSRAAFVNFGSIPHSVLHKKGSTEDWFMKTSLWVIDVRSSKKLLCCNRTKPRLSSAVVLPQMSKRVALAIVTTPTWSTSCMCAATIQGRLLFGVWLLFE